MEELPESQSLVITLEDDLSDPAAQLQALKNDSILPE